MKFHFSYWKWEASTSTQNQMVRISYKPVNKFFSNNHFPHVLLSKLLQGKTVHSNFLHFPTKISTNIPLLLLYFFRCSHFYEGRSLTSFVSYTKFHLTWKLAYIFILHDKCNQNWLTAQGSRGHEYDDQCLLRYHENKGSKSL